MGKSLSLRLRIFLFFALIAAGGIAAIVGGLALGYQHIGDGTPLDGFIIAGAVASFVLLVLAALIWMLFDENVARPIQALASDLRARAHADVRQPIDEQTGRHLGDLAPAVCAAAEGLVEARGALTEAVARETVRMAEENARLAAILRDVPAGVLVCTPEHRIALYNAEAATLLAGAGHIGLDRPLFGLLRDGPIRHAHHMLSRRPGAAGAVPVLCTTIAGNRMLEGRMRLIGETDAGAPIGYVLTLADITGDLAIHGARERLLRDVTERAHRAAADLRAEIEALQSPALEQTVQAQLQEAIGSDAGALVRWCAELDGRLGPRPTGWWPRELVASGDVAEGLTATLESDGITLPAEVAPLMLSCDGFAIVQLLAAATRTFAAPYRPLLVITPDNGGTLIDLEWEGSPPPLAEVERWLAEPLAGGYPGISGRGVLESHGTEIWPERSPRGARLRLPIPPARPESVRADVHVRPEFYDFGLLGADDRLLDDERPLAELGFVVFDTETTGLAPSKGDEIVQMAAVRILNGRLLTGENLDFLVDPGRPIPAASTAVHRVTEEMVRGAPGPAEACRRFHAYAADSVLVAHNAPFDMAFLHRHEHSAGVRLTNPVLDTVRLSSVLYGSAADHSLDALALRLDVPLPPEERHTALGDAAATGRILIKMLPMLREIGIVTLGQALRATR